MAFPWKTYMERRLQDREIRKFLDDLDDRVTALENVNNVVIVTTTTFNAGDEGTILVDDDAAGGIVTINLPLTTTRDTPYYIKKLGSTANVVVQATSPQRIDKAITQTAVIGVQFDSIRVTPGISDWWVT
jgi:hypothetical protein